MVLEVFCNFLCSDYFTFLDILEEFLVRVFLLKRTTVLFNHLP